MYPILEMKNITKTFGQTVANNSVDLSLYKGEIHALLGENGAGKSTLMNILLGIYRPNSGEIHFKGNQISIRTPKDAINLGFGMVHQHFELIPTLTVAENISLRMEKSSFFINKRKMNQQISSISEKFNLPVDAQAKIWQLSVGEQQRVEIIKLLCRDCEILILDEPTAILTPQEARELFKTLRRMADEGRSVIFISHKLNETMENADRITVLKGGRVEDTLCAKDATIPRLTKAVVGSRTICDFVSKEQKPIEGSALINVENLWVKNDKGLDALKDVSFEMYSGEIFAIAGVAGNGQRELAESLAGLRKVASGKIFMDGKDLTDSGAKQRIVEGVSFIPEDRLKMGLIPEISLDKNAILKEFRNSSYSKYGIMNRTSIRATSQDHIDNFDIKCGGANLPVSMMSGGNQQKLLVAREVNMNPRFIIAAYPVRGLDIGATETINQILLNERNKGTCVLLISEDLDEIFDVADRVAVLCDGVLMGIREICHTDFEEIGCLMSGENTEKDGSNG